MYTSIEIDFDVFKELTIRRKGPETTENDVLRELLGLGFQEKHAQEANGTEASKGKPWIWKEVTFPSGTEFRAVYGGQTYYAKVENGALVYNGERYKSPSPAAYAITGNSVNGWKFWECKIPGSSRWVLIDNLRNK